ncbi:MAG: hypothetical protein LC745_12140, partial [Planctomycetia bacterium]|nr:hypothetical protein [Planctomycetia bacterium]
ALVIGLVFLYLVMDTYRVSGMISLIRSWLTFGVIGLLASAACLRVYLRSSGERRHLTLVPDARAYELNGGLFRRQPLCSGRYEDFAGVRLERRERLVYYRNRPPRLRVFWAVLLDWKDKAGRPFCVEEFPGPFVDPGGEFPLAYESYHRSAQAVMRRWADDLGTPALDRSRD